MSQSNSLNFDVTLDNCMYVFTTQHQEYHIFQSIPLNLLT